MLVGLSNLRLPWANTKEYLPKVRPVTQIQRNNKYASIYESGKPIAIISCVRNICSCVLLQGSDIGFKILCTYYVDKE